MGYIMTLCLFLAASISLKQGPLMSSIPDRTHSGILTPNYVKIESCVPNWTNNLIKLTSGTGQIATTFILFVVISDRTLIGCFVKMSPMCTSHFIVR